MSANCIPSELVVCRAVTRPLFFHTGVAPARLEQLIVTETIDLNKKTKQELRTLFEQIEGRQDIFLFSIPIYPLTCRQRAYRQRAVIESLQDVFGQNIWERCIIVFTRGDGLWDWLIKRHGKDEAMIQYEQFVIHFAGSLEEELRQLNVQKVTVKAIFGSDSEQRETTVIPALLAEPLHRNSLYSNLEEIPDIYTSGHIIIFNEIIGKDRSTKLTDQGEC